MATIYAILSLKNKGVKLSERFPPLDKTAGVYILLNGSKNILVELEHCCLLWLNLLLKFGFQHDSLENCLLF